MIRVLLVDDSPSVRAVLRRFFGRAADIEVCGEAIDGAAAVQAVLDLQPQVVIMDLQMPVMDGYVAIERIMELRPTPIVVLSSRANRNQMRTAFEAIRRGAIEVLPKPEDTASWEVLAASLPETVRGAVGARPRVIPPHSHRHRTPTPRTAAAVRPDRRTARSRGDAPPDALPLRRARESAAGAAPTLGQAQRWVAIGASTGGPAALRELLGEVPPAPPASFLVVQHIAAGFEAALADWLNKELDLDVRLARDGETPIAGTVRLAPGGVHLRLEAGGVLRLHAEVGPGRPHCPSADELFFSCATSFPGESAGVLLTGMGTDGADGLLALRRAGALTLVQDEASSVVFGMPRVALERGAADLALSPSDLARTLARWFGSREQR
jgi:two-component system, chemotaxis family, protein-glutamate methylesterase/glutaminase